jgi:MFS family permease
MGKRRNSEADWVGWVLQYIFGFVIGAFLSFVCLELLGPRQFIEAGWHFLLFLLGGALIAAGAFSYEGDAEVMSDYSRHFPPNVPRRSRRSVLCSWLSEITGLLLIFYYLGVYGFPSLMADFYQ